MKSLSQYITESKFAIPSFTTNAMEDIFDCKNEDALIKFFDDQGFEVENIDTKTIMNSVQAVKRYCEYRTIESDIDLIDRYNSDELSRQAVEAELELGTAACWVVYTTDGDTEMLVIESKKPAAEKILRDFVKGCDRDVILAYSWN